MRLDRDQFAARVDASRREHPLWFDLPADRVLAPARRAELEASLGARLPDDFAWFLETYGGGEFAFSVIYSADRESELYLVGRQDERLASGAIAFSDNGCGDVYAFPSVDGVCTDTVVVLDHETGSCDLAEPDGFLRFLAVRALRNDA